MRDERQAILEAGGVESRGSGDVTYSHRLNKTVNAAYKTLFRIDGEDWTKLEVMERICQEIAGGASLMQACRVPGMPSPRSVMAWAKADGGFKSQLEDAEQVRGQVLAEGAIELAMAVSDPKDAPMVKIQVEAHKWMASKLNVKFSDRQVIEHKHELESVPTDELQARLKAALAAHPELLAQAAALGVKVDPA